MTPAEALREKLAVAIFPDDLFGENCYLIRRRDPFETDDRPSRAAGDPLLDRGVALP